MIYDICLLGHSLEDHAQVFAIPIKATTNIPVTISRTIFISDIVNLILLWAVPHVFRKQLIYMGQ